MSYLRQEKDTIPTRERERKRAGEMKRNRSSVTDAD